MDHSQQLELVRNLVRERFAHFGLPPEQATCETILIREGFYCGRRFHCDSWRAIWFVEEHVVKFYTSEGDFRESVDLNELSERSDDASERAA